ncbi:TRAP transporter substrate-binding protein [Brucella gallinifaecis]|uniref:TRAP transporter substrate-binding protein n=1 Tax=Brucella gallinifaecis TaxID=215590 RepID=UPI00235EB69F|nr:TRAP transporter substrate-binding protein [Brucella gallinifaecis]
MLNRRHFIGAAAAVGGMLAMPAIARANSVSLLMANATSEAHPSHIACVQFKEKLEELAPGAFNVQIFGNRQLGDDKQCLESTIAGTLQACNASGALFPMVTGLNSMEAWQLPFVVENYDHFTRLSTSEVTDKIHDEMKEAGLVGLATVNIGQRHFLSVRRPVKALADLSGQKTRIVPIPLHKEIWEQLGAAPVGLPFGEIYAALETGVIDAVEINVSSMLTENYWEVAKHFTLTGHYPWTSSTVLNKDFFDAQPVELQQALIEAGRQSVAPTIAYTAKQDLEGRDFLREKGVEIVEISDKAAMQERVAPLVEAWSHKSPLISEFVKAAQATA